MTINTNLKGRVRNTTLSKANGLMPLFEAVVNSIHSIEEAQLTSETGKISITIIRSTELDIDKAPITGFKITDNGVGFNNPKKLSWIRYENDYGTEGINFFGNFLRKHSYSMVSKKFSKKLIDSKSESFAVEFN